MKRFAWVAAVAALCGCASPFADMTVAFDRLRGQKVQEAYEALGYPDRIRDVAELRYSEWRTDDTSTFMMPTTNYGSGYVGTTPYTYSYDSATPMQIRSRCYVRVVSDKEDRIVNAFAEGNADGCNRYAARLRRAGLVRRE